MADDAPNRLSIAEVADQVGVTRRTIRYYVAEGLLPAPGGRGQKRVYTSEHLLRIRAILRLKAAFLPLGEIRARLSNVTLAELRRLCEADTSEAAPADSTPPTGSAGSSMAARYRGEISVASLGQFLASRGAAPGSHLIDAARRAGESPSRMSAASASVDEVAEAGVSIWRRVALAPGVELHYQLSGDRRRDEAIAHLIRAASSILR